MLHAIRQIRGRRFCARFRAFFLSPSTFLFPFLLLFLTRAARVVRVTLVGLALILKPNAFLLVFVLWWVIRILTPLRPLLARGFVRYTSVFTAFVLFFAEAEEACFLFALDSRSWFRIGISIGIGPRFSFCR